MTLLDPAIVGGSALSRHGWPYDFYINSIKYPNSTSYSNIGFTRCLSGGNYDPKLPKGKTPIKAGGSALQVQYSSYSSPTFIHPNLFRFDGINSLSSSPNQIVISESSLILGGAPLRTGRSTLRINETSVPAWHAMEIALADKADLVRFSGEFLSDDESKAIITIYWDGRLIATLDQRGVTPAVTDYIFALPKIYDPGTFSFSVRVDTFGTEAASFRLSSLTFGLSGSLRILDEAVLQPAGFEPDENDGFSLMSTSDPTKVYRFETSKNLTDWNPVIDRVYSSGLSEKLTDGNAEKGENRFYRLLELAN